MFDKILSAKNVESNANYALFAGVFFTLVSFITSYVLFKRTQAFVGVATVLFAVVLSLPILVKLFDAVPLNNQSSFFKKTRHLYDFYVYFFIGSFVVFFLLSLAVPSKVLSADQLFGTETKIILAQKAGLPPPPVDQSDLIVGIFKNNFYVMAISFILSLLYGAGSLLLLTLNASIFASSLSSVIRQTALSTDVVHLYTVMSCNMGVMFFHMIPEVTAYFLSAIAGGVLSYAVGKEKLFSSHSFKIIRNSLMLFAAAVIVLIIAAVIEVKISRNLLSSATCLKNTAGVLIATILIIVAVVVLEFKRKKHSV